jgi:ATP-dependent Clp protease ATP-binding subunit ClpB
MKKKLLKIALFFLLMSTSQFQAAQISNLHSSLSSSATTYRHVLQSVSDDGSLVTFEDGLSIAINWWYRSTAKQWKEGDLFYLTYSFQYRQINLQPVYLQTCAWGSIQDYPVPLWVIQTIPGDKDNPDAYSTIELDNGYVFKSKKHREFARISWKEKEQVFALANPDGFYQIWNVEKDEISLCKFIKNYNQTEPNSTDIQDILYLEDRLNAKVLQQQEATKALLSALMNYSAGLKEKEKPIGVFLFIGPTGVGKTELAKTLASEMYGDSNKILRFDMSHFSEEHTISRLMGSPVGYINHEEGGQLTNPLLSNPQIVVLLDEVEKAHVKVMKVFLPVFDEGFISDNKNRRISCSDTVFIMTSNLCSNKIVKLYNQGYSSEEILDLIEPELMQALSPELYNRVEPILFRPLARETMVGLVDLMLGNIAKRLKSEKQIQIHVDESLKSFLAENGYHPLLGARPLKRLIEKRVVSRLAYSIIKEGIQEGSEIFLFYDKEKDTVLIQQG